MHLHIKIKICKIEPKSISFINVNMKYSYMNYVVQKQKRNSKHVIKQKVKSLNSNNY